MLDLSATFDQIIPRRINESHGITGQAQDWFKSYFARRYQCVRLDFSGDFRVTQGSVLGPKAYCIYNKPVGDIIRKHGVMYHCYAGDTHIYIVIKPSKNNWNEAICKLEIYVKEIKNWMEVNLLKLNDEKTELMVHRNNANTYFMMPT